MDLRHLWLMGRCHPLASADHPLALRVIPMLWRGRGNAGLPDLPGSLMPSSNPKSSGLPEAAYCVHVSRWPLFFGNNSPRVIPVAHLRNVGREASPESITTTASWRDCSHGPSQNGGLSFLTCERTDATRHFQSPVVMDSGLGAFAPPRNDRGAPRDA